jgi:hypothetical protein
MIFAGAVAATFGGMVLEPNMKELPVVEVEFDEVKELADLIGLHNDLASVVEMTRRLSEMLRQDEQDQDGLMVKSLWTSALVTYIRCFASGKRYGLTESIYSELPGEPTTTHKYYKDTRDKHIAHSVNAFEETVIGIILSNEESQPIEVLGVANLTVHRISDSVEGIDQLGVLAEFARRYIAQKGQEVQDKILNKAKSLTTEQLRALPRLGVMPQGGADAARTPRS